MVEFACFMKEIKDTWLGSFDTINSTKKAVKTVQYLGRITK